MNKIKIFLLSIISLIGSILFIDKVYARTDEYLTVDTQAGVFYTMTGDDGYFSADPFSYYTMDGKTVYCIEQGVKLDGRFFHGEEGFTNSPFPLEINRRIEIIGHYGYDYPGHQTQKYRMATQALVWEAITGYNVNFYTENYGWGDYIDVSYEREQIMNLVNNHYIKPSFNNQTFNVSLNQELVLDDTNYKISDYQIYNSNGNDVKIENNKLFITANKVGQTSIQFVKKNYDSATTFFYVADDGYSQKLAFFRSSDPMISLINLNVVGGKIKIKKVDSETNLCKSQGQASLIGAKYGVYDSSSNLVETLTIGDDCSATTDYLPYGNYKIKELSASTGYEIDVKVYDATITDTNIVEVISSENVIRGKIRIKKYDSETNSCKSSGQATLIGAKYGIYDSNNNLVDTLTIGDDCTATSKYLPYSKYQIREISAPIGYELDTKVYDINITDTSIVDVISNENVIRGKIRIKKADSETNSCKSQGQASLIGAKYGIYDSNNNLVETLIIGDDCTATTNYLPYGNYKIKELSAPIGYEIDTKVYDVNIINTSIIEVVSKEKVIKNYISILKQYDYVDGNTTFLNAESGITFEIYNQDNVLYDTITTDKNGYATLEISYGIWKFHQVNSHIGFEKIYDFYITVNENSESEQYYNILNNKLSAYLKVVKVDSETGNTIAIADTTFKILNTDTNQYVSQFVAGKVYDTFKTDSDGVMTTYLKLESGNYKLIEVSSPHNYLINTDGLEFTIGEDTYYNYTTYGAFVTVYFDDQVIKGQIEINKKGEDVVIENGNFTYQSKPLENVVFEIYANEDILSADGNTLYYGKDQLVDTITTNKDGYAISKPLYLGSYYVIETKTNDDYVLDSKKYEFTLVEKDNKTPIVYHNYNAVNCLKKGILEFTKTDIATGKGIADTKVEIYHLKDDGISELVFTGITDYDGKITITDLFIGRFTIIETDSATGYKLSDEIVSFEIKENGEIVKANMTNEKIKSTIKIHKIDDNKNSLSGVEIGIYDLDGNLLNSYITDENGDIEVELEYGSYYFQEIKSLDGYILNDEKVYFDINEDGEYIQYTLVNETETIEVPNTKLNNCKILDIIGFILIIVGVSYITYDKKRKK